MNRRLIVLLCILWGVGCCGLVFAYAADRDVEKETLHQSEISFTIPDSDPVSLPYKLPGTDLLVRDIYPQDPTNRVTALLVENVGIYGIERARIVICRGSRLLRFTADRIPSGAKVIVLDESGTEYCHEPIKYCYGSQRIYLD